MTEALIETRLWRQFVAVAQELHFGRAAQRLHMTQPPLTQAIAALETTLQVRLFDRTKRSVHLTAAGNALLPSVQDLLARAAALPDKARDAAQGKTGRLRLAFVSTVGFALLPRWVRAFREQQPAVQLVLVEATSDLQLQALQRGEMDAGFMVHSPGFELQGLTQLRVSQEPLVLAVAEQNPLAQVTRVTLSKALTQPLVMFPRRIAPSLHDAVFSLYQLQGRSPQIAQEAIQMQTIVNLVSADLGVAWVPDSVRQFQRPGVVYKKVVGARIPACEVSLVWQPPVSPALSRFVAFAREQIRRDSQAE
jgi:DNA-binding transcriptional LysR family regulator